MSCPIPRGTIGFTVAPDKGPVPVEAPAPLGLPQEMNHFPTLDSLRHNYCASCYSPVGIQV